MTKKILIFTAFFLCVGIVSAQNKNAAKAYLNEQKTVLNSIEALSSETEQQFDSIFWAKWEGHKKMKIAFHEAMCGMLTKAKYYNQYFKDELEQRAWVILNDDLIYFKQTQKLSNNSLTAIKPLLEQRSKETAYAEYRFFTNSKKRSEAIGKIREKYRERISQVTMKNNSRGATYNLGLVLENRERLNLTNAQVDSIVAAAQRVKALQKNGKITKEKNNRWEYERTYIMQFLDETQVSDFLAIRNYDYALGYAKRSWKEMQDYDIAFEYDSVATVQQITVYQLNKNKIQYIYKDNPDQMKEMDDYLYRTSYPVALKQLRVAKRQRNNQETNEQNELVF